MEEKLPKKVTVCPPFSLLNAKTLELSWSIFLYAGIGTPSEATKAMEIGADGILLNTAIASV